MRERIRFMLVYYFFWVAFYIIARIVFLVYHVDDSKILTLETLFGIFKNGILMDLSMAAYLCILPFLWVTFSNYINKSVFQNTIFSYTFIFLTINLLIIVVDMEVYNIWNFRLDNTPLKFLSTPKEAFISLKHSPIFRLILSYLIIVGIASAIIYRIVANKIYDWKHIENFPFLIYGLLITSILIIPMRGGFKKGFLKQDTVYFSKNYFANISALNAPWNFAYSLLKRTSDNENKYTFLPKENLNKAISSLYSKSGVTTQIIKPKKQPNVLLILVENFSSKVVDQNFDGRSVTPNFNKIKEEGIYFENFYAASDRSDKTVLSILSGYPSQPKEAMVDFSHKIENLPIISKNFYDKGYSTQFYYGGDANFLSLKPYLFAGNFEKILEKNDYKTTSSLGSLGLADEVLYDQLLQDLNKQKGKPFFSTVLTLSSNEPFDIPGQKVFEKSSESSDILNALYYADSTLNNFISEAKKQVWWDNTLIIIVGNKGNKLPITDDKTENFKVPMLWTGGVISKPLKITNVYSQIDLASTLLAQLKFPYKEFTWSKNIFDTGTKPWAFYVFNDGFGFINNTKKVVFDNVGRRLINDQKMAKTYELQLGKALQQKTYQDFLNR